MRSLWRRSLWTDERLYLSVALSCLLFLLVACDGNNATLVDTPTAAPTETVTPDRTPDEVDVLNTRLAHMEATVSAAKERLAGFTDEEASAVQTEGISEATQARWISWMSDERAPVFQFWRDPSSGKWVAVCHIVARVWSPQYKTWYEDAGSVDAALTKVLDKMDADLELR